MASTINASTSPAAIVQTADGTGILALQTAGTTAVTIDASQNVGIGTASPAGKLDVQATNAANAFMLTATTGTNSCYSRYSNTGGFLYMGRDNSAGSDFGAGAYTSALYSTGAYPLIFATNSTERMRIDSSGNLLVGTTTAKTYGQVQVYKASSFGYGQYSASDPGYNSGASQWVFGMNSTGAFTVYINPTQSGNYGVYLNAGATSWTANSDERLKDITGNIDNAIASVQSLRAVKFTLKADTEEEKTARVGLIAQDVEKVLPEIVDTNEQGYLGIRYSELTPLLVAAIQEQQALITSLTARITALEGASL